MIGTPIDKASATKGAIPIHYGTSSHTLTQSGNSNTNSSRIRDGKDSKGYVTDAQGRRRFHGAFTGGFSAGYFNTVGSAEGFTPGTFSSSREDTVGGVSSSSSSSSSQPPSKNIVRQHVRDFMDEEDEQDFNFTNSSVSVGTIRDTNGSLFQPSQLYKGVDVSSNSSTAQHINEASDPFQRFLTGSTKKITDLSTNEFIIPQRSSIGKLLLHHCGGGWHEGMKLGYHNNNSLKKPKNSSSTLSVSHNNSTVTTNVLMDDTEEDHDNEEEDFEKEMQLLWDEGTSRPPHSYYGLGYDPHSLRSHATATTTLLSHQRMNKNNDNLSVNLPNDRENKRYRVGDILESNDKHTKFLASLSGTGSSKLPDNPKTITSTATNNTKRKYNLMSFDIDDEEGNNDNIYSEPSLLEYDIPSIQQRTGLGIGKSLPSNSIQSIIPSINDSSLSSSSSSSSSSTLADIHNCADGLPPLPGFHLAQRTERSFVTFTNLYRPFLPSSDYQVQPHIFTEDLPPTLPLYEQYGYTINKVIDTGTDDKADTSSHPIKKVQSSDTTRTKPPPGWLTKIMKNDDDPDTNILKSKFVPGPTIGGDDNTTTNDSGTGKLINTKEGIVTIAANASKVHPSSSSLSSSSISSSKSMFTVGQILSHTETVWIPNRLVLKRFNIPDPFTKETRKQLEEQDTKDNAGINTNTNNLGIRSSTTTNTKDTVPTVPSTESDPNLYNSNLSYNTTLASLVFQRPPDALYQAIFQPVRKIEEN